MQFSFAKAKDCALRNVCKDRNLWAILVHLMLGKRHFDKASRVVYVDIVGKLTTGLSYLTRAEEEVAFWQKTNVFGPKKYFQSIQNNLIQPLWPEHFWLVYI